MRISSIPDVLPTSASRPQNLDIERTESRRANYQRQADTEARRSNQLADEQFGQVRDRNETQNNLQRFDEETYRRAQDDMRYQQQRQYRADAQADRQRDDQRARGNVLDLYA